MLKVFYYFTDPIAAQAKRIYNLVYGRDFVLASCLSVCRHRESTCDNRFSFVVFT